MSDRVDLLVASAQEAIRDLRTYHDHRDKRARLLMGRVQATCAVAVAIDRVADALLALAKE